MLGFLKKSRFSKKNSGLFYFFSTPYSQIGECKSVDGWSTRSLILWARRILILK